MSELAALVTYSPPVELRALADTEPEQWLARFRAWVDEPFFEAQAFLRDVRARGVPGRWVAVTASVGTQPFPGAGVDGTFATALHTLVKVAALENGPFGITCNAVAVGWREGELPEALEDTPTGRFARDDDVRGAVEWLLSDAASHVNGEVIRVDGGYTITRSSRLAPNDEIAGWLVEDEWR